MTPARPIYRLVFSRASRAQYWFGWQEGKLRPGSKSGIKAVGTDEHSGRVLYGDAARRALARQAGQPLPRKARAPKAAAPAQPQAQQPVQQAKPAAKVRPTGEPPLPPNPITDPNLGPHGVASVMAERIAAGYAARHPGDVKPNPRLMAEQKKRVERQDVEDKAGLGALIAPGKAPTPAPVPAAPAAKTPAAPKAKAAPRAKAGRKTVDETLAHIQELKASQSTDFQTLAKTLQHHTVAEIQQIKAKLGLKASGPKKDVLAEKIAKLALAHQAAKPKAEKAAEPDALAYPYEATQHPLGSPERGAVYEAREAAGHPIRHPDDSTEQYREDPSSQAAVPPDLSAEQAAPPQAEATPAVPVSPPAASGPNLPRPSQDESGAMRSRIKSAPTSAPKTKTAAKDVPALPPSTPPIFVKLAAAAANGDGALSKAVAEADPLELHDAMQWAARKGIANNVISNPKKYKLIDKYKGIARVLAGQHPDGGESSAPAAQPKPAAAPTPAAAKPPTPASAKGPPPGPATGVDAPPIDKEPLTPAQDKKIPVEDVPKDEQVSKAEKTPEAIKDAMQESYKYLKKFVEFRDGIVELRRLWYEAKERIPSLTVEEFHKQLESLNKDWRISLRVLNEVHMAEEPHLAINRDGRMYYYVTWPTDEEHSATQAKNKAAMAEHEAKMRVRNEELAKENAARQRTKP